jgi:hypothetical protein
MLARKGAGSGRLWVFAQGCVWGEAWWRAVTENGHDVICVLRVLPTPGQSYRVLWRAVGYNCFLPCAPRDRLPAKTLPCLAVLSKCSAKAGTSLDHHLDRPSTTHIDTPLPSLIHAIYHYSTAALPYPTRSRLPRLFALPQEPVLLQSQQLLLGLHYVTGLATPSGFRASAP